MSVARAVPVYPPPRILQVVCNNLFHIECNGAKSISDSGGSGFTKPDLTSHKPLQLPVGGEEEIAVKRASSLSDNHRRYRSRATALPAVGFAATQVFGRSRTVTACLSELNLLVLQPIRCDRALVEVV